ncbi:hypothetical protein STEG23_023844, partial [Scotinomys teguina]
MKKTSCKSYCTVITLECFRVESSCKGLAEQLEFFQTLVGQNYMMIATSDISQSIVLQGWRRRRRRRRRRQHTPVIPALGRQRHVDLCEFDASLVYKGGQILMYTELSESKYKISENSQLSNQCVHVVGVYLVGVLWWVCMCVHVQQALYLLCRLDFS